MGAIVAPAIANPVGQFSTATGLLACGVALLALRDPGAAPRRRRLGRLLAAYALVLGTAFLAEYVLGADLGIDELPFRDVDGREAGAPYPGRLAPAGAPAAV